MHLEKENYIQIAATSSTNELDILEYLEELFWWDNDPYFDQILLNKIQKISLRLFYVFISLLTQSQTSIINT